MFHLIKLLLHSIYLIERVEQRLVVPKIKAIRADRRRLCRLERTITLTPKPNGV